MMRKYMCLHMHVLCCMYMCTHMYVEHSYGAGIVPKVLHYIHLLNQLLYCIVVHTSKFGYIPLRDLVIYASTHLTQFGSLPTMLNQLMYTSLYTSA